MLNVEICHFVNGELISFTKWQGIHENYLDQRCIDFCNEHNATCQIDVDDQETYRVYVSDMYKQMLIVHVK